MKENIDYELIPGQMDHWNIRILTGDYVETVFNFGAIKVSDDGESLNYSAEIVSTPVEINDEDISWHETTGGVLLDILQRTMDNAK